MAKNVETITKEKIKADLEKQIAKKLSQLNETDLEELFAIHEQQRKVKQPKDELEGQFSFEAISQTDESDESQEIKPSPDTDFETRVEKLYKEYDVFEQEKIEEEAAEGEVAKTRLGEAAQAAKQKTVKIAQAVKHKTAKAVQAVRRKADERKAAKQTEPLSPNQRAVKYLFLLYKRRFVRSEKKAAASMADLITRIDERNDEIAKKTTRMVRRSNLRFYLARKWADVNKKKLLLILLVIVSTSIGAAALFNTLTAYAYAYNGRTLGMVKNQEDVLKILEVVSEQLTREYGMEIDIDKDQDITFERVLSIHKEIDDMQDVLNRLTYMQDMNAKAYAIYIDGKRVAILDTESGAEKILQRVKDQYTTKSEDMKVDLERVDFAEKVELRQLDTQLGRIQNPDDVMTKILTGAVEKKVHIVKKGETFSEIAKVYGLSQAELEESNPGINPARLNIDQEILLTQAVPMLTVQTIEVVTYLEEIPYDTIYENNANAFKGEQSVKVKGVNGKREVTTRIIKSNGFEVGKEELNSIILQTANSAVVSVGTKEPPPQQGTGKFSYPVRGRLTSKFGMRSGRMHYGIDLACSTGTRISASDGGTVTFAGYSGSYGYVVKINHGKNYETLYAHCSKLYVKKGDKVYKGQHIANVGNTGRSTGPHCHFEVHVNGVQKNPLNYL